MRHNIFHILILLWLAAPVTASAASWCRATSLPKVTVNADTDNITWDFSKSEKTLNTLDIDTVNPYGNTVITDVGGLMHGGIKISESMQFNSLVNKTEGLVCMFYDNVTVDLHIQPTIYIANENPPGSCKHNAIKQHELKHIETDRNIVNKYSLLIGRAIEAEIKRQNIYGPYPENQTQAVQEMMRGRMDAILQTYNNSITSERRTLQQRIDSLQEYERVNHLCDGVR